MNIHEAYTIYNNSLKTMNPVLAEAIDRIIDNKAIENHRLRETLKQLQAAYELALKQPTLKC